MAQAGKRWRTHRRDANEKGICAALEAVGATITKCSGKGAPDILCHFRGTLFAFEIKTAKGTQTEAQQKTQWPVIRSAEQALAWIGAVK